MNVATLTSSGCYKCLLCDQNAMVANALTIISMTGPMYLLRRRVSEAVLMRVIIILAVGIMHQEYEVLMLLLAIVNKRGTSFSRSSLYWSGPLYPKHGKLA